MSNFLNSLLNLIPVFLTNPKKLVIDIAQMLAVIACILIIAYLIDQKRDYSHVNWGGKLKKRTSKNAIGGGQEYYIRYWVWQRKKRQHIIYYLVSHTKDGYYYPKQKWLKVGQVRLPFRRECWIHADDARNINQ